MNFLAICLATYFCLLGIKGEVVSDEDYEKRPKNNGKYIFNSNKLHRRFLEDVDDNEWHVSHLKDTDFGGRKSFCEGETFEDRARTYKRMLKNDGALVDFVSADPLPFNKTDLIKDTTCKIIDITNANNWKNHVKAETVDNVKDESETINQDGSMKNKSNLENDRNSNNEMPLKIDEEYTNRSVNKEVETATTVDSKATSPQMNKVQNESAEEKSRRASEYMFSSAEYYDETDEFDDSSCPGVVEIITLELDQLRNYDVKCEAIVEWRSLT